MAIFRLFSRLQAGNGGAPRRILVLERQGVLARSLASVLPRSDYSVHVAPQAAFCSTCLVTCAPDLVLLALEHPSDWDLLRRIRAQSNVPIIACACGPDRADGIRSLEQGADDFVLWPSAAEELGARVEARLRRASWSSPTN